MKEWPIPAYRLETRLGLATKDLRLDLDLAPQRLGLDLDLAPRTLGLELDSQPKTYFHLWSVWPGGGLCWSLNGGD